MDGNTSTLPWKNMVQKKKLESQHCVLISLIDRASDTPQVGTTFPALFILIQYHTHKYKRQQKENLNLPAVIPYIFT